MKTETEFSAKSSHVNRKFLTTGKARTHVLLLSVVLCFAFVPALGFFHASYAAGSTITVDSAWCMNAGGTWLSSGDGLFPTTTNTPTCRLFDTGIYTIALGDILVVPSGTALEIWPYAATTYIANYGSLNNSGAIICQAYMDILSTGTINNTGHLELDGPTGGIGAAINSTGTFYNYGTINDDNPDAGLINSTSLFYNYGTELAPILNSGTVENSGEIAKIYNHGEVDSNPEGTLGTVNNNGLLNYNGATVVSSGTIYGAANYGGTINNEGTMWYGVYNDKMGTINNFGSITKSFVDNEGILNIYQFGSISLCSNGVDCEVFNNGTLNDYGYVNNTATLNFGYGGVRNAPAGTFNIYSSAAIDTYGYFANQGIMNNGGTISSYYGFSNTGTFNNTGTINVEQSSFVNTGYLDNLGHIFNNGMLNNTNKVSDSGYIYDYGVLSNTGTIFIGSGTVDVYTSGTISNSGTMDVYSSGTIYNSGTIENYGAIYVYDSGSIVNSFFFNEGTIYNYKSGYIEIGTSGTLDNSFGTVYNYGLIDNGGTVNGSVNFINECGGQLTGDTSYTYTQLHCAVVQVTLTTADSAPVGTISISGCGVSQTTITADGNPVTITSDGSCTLTFTVPNDGTHSRYRFSDGGAPSTTWTFTTCASGTCNPISNTLYYQLENTFYVVIKGGNPNAGDTVALSDSFLGSSSSNVVTLNVGGSSSASSTAWTDYGSTVTFPLNTTNSGSSERWAIDGAYTTSPLTTGGNTVSQTYYHQFKIAFQYHTSDSSTPTAPTVYYTQFGSGATDTATTSSPPSDWVDAGTSVSYANPTSASSSERWQANYVISNEESVIDSSVSSTGTLNPSYYHQVNVTFGYTTNDGTTIDSHTNLVSYTQFGSTLHLSTDANGVISKSSDWADAGSSVTYVSPVSVSSNERYQIDSSNSGTNTVISSVSSSSNSADPEYYHQFMITFGYADQDTSTITSGATIGSYEQFGSSNSITAGTSYGSTSPTNDWVDAGIAAVSYKTYTTVSGTERWGLSISPQTFDVSASTTISESSYYHQFDVSFAYTTSDGTTIDSYTNLVNYTQFGSVMHISTNSGGTLGTSNDWVDAATAVNYTSPVLVSLGERYQIDSVDTGANTVIASVSTSDLSASPEYYHQFFDVLSYSVSGGGAPDAPNFSANLFGSVSSPTLTLSPTGYWFDAGTSWSVSPNPLTGSNLNERWYSTQTLTGDLSPSAVTTLEFTFYHQYAITFSISPSGAGTTSPSGTNVWENAGSLSISAFANHGYSFGSWSAAGSITFVNSSKSSTTATLSGPGTIEANFLINTEITYGGATSGEYSDSVSLNATLNDSFGNALSGQTLTFTIGTQSANAVTDSGGVASTTLLLNQPKGTYSVVVSFSRDSTYAYSSSTNSFALSPEPATIEYTGTASVSTSSTNGYVTFSAQVTSELNDAVPLGNITNANVTFSVYSSTGTLLYTSSPSAVIETSLGVGTASVQVSCDSFGNTACGTENTYVVYARIDSSTNNYYAASDSYNTLVVYTPSGQFVALSGSITDPNTGSLAHFGGTVRLAHHGLIQGSFIYMVTGACPTGVTSTNGLCDYQYKITSWAGGSLGFSSFDCSAGSTCYASFQGNGVLQVTDPVTGALLVSQGNVQITVGAWNNVGTSNNGGVDQFTMSVDYPQPVGSDTSYQVGTVSSPISFETGNLVVRSR